MRFFLSIWTLSVLLGAGGGAAWAQPRGRGETPSVPTVPVPGPLPFPSPGTGTGTGTGTCVTNTVEPPPYIGSVVGGGAVGGNNYNPQNVFLVGQVYFDADGNGRRDISEGPFARPVVVVNNGEVCSALAGPPMGVFSIHIDTPTSYYDILVPFLPPYYYLTQGVAGYQGPLPSSGTVGSLDFGIGAVPNQPDLRITFAPYSGLRPGLPQRYRARVENVGTDTIRQAQVMIDVPAPATIIGTVPSSQGTGSTRSWNLPTLAPFAVRELDVTFSVPVTTPVGAPFAATAAIQPLPSINDRNPYDNIDTIRQVVTSSYDPNDLTVNHSELSLSQLAGGEKLDYLIRFENLGNDTAFAVTIVDSLPASMLQIGTLQLVGSSHNCQYRIASDGVLTMTFPRIRLPYRAIDVLRSQGFVRFQVKPRPTLWPGMRIPGAAHITFDFNAAIPTNTVVTLVSQPPITAAADVLAADAPTTLYPNPATASVTLSAEIEQNGIAGVRVFDAVGRQVYAQSVTVQPGTRQLPLDLSSLRPGVYAVRLTRPGKPATTLRLVVR